MDNDQQNLLQRFAKHPTLLGGAKATVEFDRDGRGWVTLRHGDVVARLRAAGLAVPYPSGLERLRSRHPDVELVIVERAPSGLQQAAEVEEVGLLDLQGRGRVVAPGLIYVAEPRPVLAAAAPRASSPYAPKASRVVRVLLSRPMERWRLSDIAALADLNPGNVHRALSALIDQGIVERDEEAYLVADPGSLLEAWAEQQQPSRHRIRVAVEGRLRDDVREVVARVAGQAIVSGELAAEELAPYLPAESAIIHVLSLEAFSEIGPAMAGPPVPEVLGVSAPRPGQLDVVLSDAGVGFEAKRNGFSLACPQQVYVDLARDRGRGREAAEHLRHRALGF